MVGNSGRPPTVEGDEPPEDLELELPVGTALSENCDGVPVGVPPFVDAAAAAVFCVLPPVGFVFAVF
jgi:hypothetical protein